MRGSNYKQYLARHQQMLNIRNLGHALVLIASRGPREIWQFPKIGGRILTLQPWSFARVIQARDSIVAIYRGYMGIL